VLRITASVRAAASHLPRLRVATIALGPTGFLVAPPIVEPSNTERHSPSAFHRQEALVSEINWAVELRKIEREYDGLPPEPTDVEVRQKREAERREREGQEAVAASFGVYFRLTLVVCLAVSLACWPYEVTCGAMLFGYLAAVAVLIMGGIWTSSATFKHRMAGRHLISLVVIVWGIVLGAAEVLPRIGYANPAPGRSTTWHCTDN
jgi:hypothetical protein